MFSGEFDEGPLKSRWHKCCPCPSLCLPCNPILTPIRKLVSKAKRRYVKDGFDLDLVYITDRIICHGFPSTGVEHIYRNPRMEVARFLETKHAGHYKVYNFCCEPGRGYDAAIFDGRVERYPFRDHGVPPLETMTQFCNSAKAWLDANPKNVVSLHCKAGKGRAGIMTCCLLVRLGFKPSAIEAMDYYDITRVTNKKGLTVTSQRKFVMLYERLWREIWELPPKSNIGSFPAEEYPGERYPVPDTPSRNLTSVEILELPEKYHNQKFFIRVLLGTTTKKFDHEVIWSSNKIELSGEGKPSDVFDVDCAIQNNFCVQVFHVTGSVFKPKVRLCELWHNTIMMDQKTHVFDFPFGELNVKKKFRKSIDQMNIRLGFGTRRQAVTEEGIEMGEIGAIVTRQQPAFSTQL
ncbi:hypothetical protein TrCOL_g3721 [Triparma columacea]|uniref:Phosphatidylinositol-3,4,5-trisphosphate 3-phosphatase n=1 Tax=Triparma columacea TaxID=722753 RepID=A0A9W7GCB4_9STRA|nr:hypothetical protein TrCOL_g3721 [Triparma columacea]